VQHNYSSPIPQGKDKRKGEKKEGERRGREEKITSHRTLVFNHDCILKSSGQKLSIFKLTFRDRVLVILLCNQG
jgi:hypothetical protein